MIGSSDLPPLAQGRTGRLCFLDNLRIALTCGLCIGLLFLFREKLNRQNRWTKAMANAQYAAYLFHFPIVVLIQYTIASTAWSPFAKFAFVTAAAVPLTFLFADWIRRPALLRRIL